MYLFGGSNLEQENTKFFSLDMLSLKWEVVRSKGELPLTRDEHTAVVNEEDATIIIFGGFLAGERTNEVVKYSIGDNSWSKVKVSSP